VCFTGPGANVDSPWEQKKLEVKKRLKNAARTQRPMQAVLACFCLHAYTFAAYYDLA